ncbi:MAG: DUF2341 domain-containing protein [Candidatus Methanoperedens sp.]
MIKNKSYSRGHALRIAVGTTLAILLLCGSAAADALSNSGGGSWLYYKDITISNTGSALTDYQVLVNLTGNDFPTNASGSGADIRFTNESGNELSYWIENWDYTGRTARIWVKIPSIPIVPSAIRMYYGNPSALSSSNGDTTFDFFDDFSGDLSKWTILKGATAVMENGELSLMDTQNTEDFIHSKTFQTKNGIIEAKIKVISTAFVAHWIIDGRWTSPYSYISVTARLGSGYNDFYTFAGYPIKGIPWATNTLNTWFLFQLKMNEDKLEGNAYDTSGTLLKSTQGSSTTGIGYVGIRSWGSSHTHYDDIRVRKYASPEPSVTVGTEIQIPILKNITVSSSSALMVAGATQTFTATPKDQFNNPINATVTWSSSNTSVGTINPDTGVFIAKAAGTTVVTATNGSVSGSASVVVLLAPQGFRFVQLTDVHIGVDITECGFKASNFANNLLQKVLLTEMQTIICQKSRKESISKFENVVQNILELSPKPDFVLITGDLVEWNSAKQYQDFKPFLKKFKDNNIDVYIVPGNHDRRGKENPQFLIDTVFPNNGIINYKNTVDDRDYSDKSFMHKKYMFIGLDSGHDLDSIQSQPIEWAYPSGSGLSKNDNSNQIKFVNETIIDGKTIIFMHHPAIYDSSLFGSYNVISKNREEFVNLVKQKDVKLVLTGHTHDSELLYNDSNMFSVTNRIGSFIVNKIITEFFKIRKSPVFIQTRSATKDDSALHGYMIVDIGFDIFHITEMSLHDVKMTGTVSEPVSSFYIYSPADLHIYDEFGRHTGLNASGVIENNIPDSYYFEEDKIGNVTLPAFILLHNNTLNYSIKIVSNFSRENLIGDRSSFNFTIEHKTNNGTITINYNNVSINRDSQAYLQMNTTQTDYTMQLDLNNDGIPDATKMPDSITMNYAPTAIISSPTDDSIWDQGQPITFNGTGIDREDGILTRLTWISDRDDVIGHGNYTTSNLSAGVHNITLLVNDSTDQVNISNIIITVRDTKPPILSIDLPPENKIFNKQNVTVKGTAYDDSGILNVTVNGVQAGKEDWNTIFALKEGENRIEVVATDNKGFSATANRKVYYNSSLASDTRPPASIANLTHKTGYDTGNRAWINWTWENPEDEDFSYVMINLDGIHMENTSQSYFNITGLSCDATYDISILSADIVDNINNTEVKDTVRTPPPDTTPPTTTISLSGTPGSNNWYTSDVQVILTAADDEAGAGIAKTEFSFDGTNWSSYTTLFNISSEGITTVYYRSTDNAGNVEMTRNQTINIDKTSPIISISGVTDGSYYNYNVTPVIAVTDTNLHTQTVALNGAPYVSGTPIFAESGYTLTALATDMGGNKAYKAVNFTIDKTPPEAAIRFDTTSRDIKVYNNETGSEVNYTGLPSKKNKDSKEDDGDEKGWKLRQYVLADKAGNSLVLVLKHKKEGKEVKVEVLSTQYNDQTVINAVENKMQAEYSEDKNGLLKELEQAIEAKKRFEAGAKYSAKKNESEIKVKLDGQKEQKETISGIATLELLTEKGGLKLRY